MKFKELIKRLYKKSGWIVTLDVLKLSEGAAFISARKPLNSNIRCIEILR